MNQTKSESRWGYDNGFLCTCGIIVVDIVGSSQLKGRDQDQNQTKINLENLITHCGRLIDGKLKWNGDGGEIFVPGLSTIEYDHLVSLTIQIKYALNGFNNDPVMGNLLESDISCRISCHTGLVSFNENPKQIQGDCLNWFLKNERELGKSGIITITQEVQKQLSARLQNMFIEEKIKIKNSSTAQQEEYSIYRFNLQAHPNHNKRYCLAHSDFKKKYKEAFETYPIVNDLHSKLFYIFLNVNGPNFYRCKKKIENYFNGEVHNNQDEDISLMYLLGSSEILVKFHSTYERAIEIERRIQKELEGYLPFPTNELLDEPSIIRIDIQKEYIRDDKYTNYNEGSLKPNTNSIDLDENLRSIKAIIKLDSGERKFNDKTINTLKDDAIEYVDIIEKFSISHDRTKIIIEIYIPCGLFSGLNDISKKLESRLGGMLRKDTYIAYQAQYWSIKTLNQ
ncbi:MAG: hypothetical protein F6K36_01030 [Symploca sp. SIO3C6]|uniref:Uncharacterized protein n=1 Tax=Symploca sp. SIO1C4 TaxID=2607765 RepID=A0A6B3NI39_9CYAN|nr:hypothetical protein [Symploca sp. SIO3C6]NER31343.1 hypothetical protein [Symploca sp. SIO1C4]